MTVMDPAKIALAQTVVRLAESADNLAMSTDGPVPPTWDCMTQKDLKKFFQCSYLLAEKVLRDEG